MRTHSGGATWVWSIQVVVVMNTIHYSVYETHQRVQRKGATRKHKHASQGTSVWPGTCAPTCLGGLSYAPPFVYTDTPHLPHCRRI
jgi:hypothetical protein